MASPASDFVLCSSRRPTGSTFTPSSCRLYVGSWPRRSGRSTSSSSKSTSTSTTCRRNRANGWGRRTCRWSSREAANWPGRARVAGGPGRGLAAGAGRRESAVPGSPGPPGPRAGDRDRALEPVEQAGRRRPRAVSRQASRAAPEPGPPGGNRPAAGMESHAQEGRPECDYSVMVSRAEKRRAADFWPIRLRDRLPVIPIPLRPPDAAAGSISRKCCTEPTTAPATSTSSIAASRNRACRRTTRPGHGSLFPRRRDVQGPGLGLRLEALGNSFRICGFVISSCFGFRASDFVLPRRGRSSACPSSAAVLLRHWMGGL